MTEGFVSRRSLSAIVSLFAAMLVLCLSATHARAETKPFHIDFDKSNIQLGTVGDLPLDSLTTGASIDGTIDQNGVVTIPADGFKFPKLGITDPIAVSGAMSLDGPATGQFDEKTGKLELDATAGIYVTLDVKGLIDTLSASGIDLGTLLGSGGSVGGFSLSTIIGLVPTLTCGFTGMDVHYTTGATSPTGLATGAPFLKGPDGPGALAAEWSQLGVFGGQTKILGFLDACSLLKSYLPTLLTSLTGSGTGSTLPIDLGSLDLGSLLNNLDNVNLGPSALTLTRTLDTSVPVGPTGPTGPDETTDPARLKLSATPKKRIVKRGKSINYKVTVSNTGDDSADGVKVCVKVPKKALATKPCKTIGGVAGGSSRKGNFKVKVKASAGKGLYMVKFTANSKSVNTARAVVRILAK